jgi:tetratricopeptide (TPR) repeat protein
MRRRWTRPAVVTAAAVAALLGAGAVLGPNMREDHAVVSAASGPVSPAHDLEAYVQRTTRHLSRTPGDWHAWAQLGMAHVQIARITADPSHYASAEAALKRSLTESPDDNAAALTGLGALAAARHDFIGALRYARRAVTADAWSADAYGVVTDALVELGRYRDATDAVQRMLDLRPDTGSFGRASYLFELNGDNGRARELMQRALDVAANPADATFALQNLGDLAFGAGDLDRAEARYTEGLLRRPGQPSLLAGPARVAAARGDLRAAVDDLRTATSTLPTVEHLVLLSDMSAAAGDTAGAARADDLVRVSDRLATSASAATDIDLVLFYADRGPTSEAVKRGRALLAARPSVSVETAYAWALHQVGDDREALAHADRGLRLHTRHALPYYYRGMIRHALGDEAGARTDLAQALRINPHFSVRYAPGARATLTKLEGAR